MIENGIGLAAGALARLVDIGLALAGSRSSEGNGVLYSSAKRAASAALRGPGVAAHDQRRMRALDRLGLGVEVRQRVVLALEGERPVAPSARCTIWSCSSSTSIRSAVGRNGKP